MATRTGSTSALVVVDVQVGVVANAFDRDPIVQNVALAVERARSAGAPVIWVQHHDEELQRDTPAWQWTQPLQPMDGEPRIYKQFNSSFEDTPLLEVLDQLKVAHIVLAGAASNWCIRATAYGALERGFDLTLVGDAHTTEDMQLGPGATVEAKSIIEDLNMAMRWLSYPGRKNNVVNAADLVFRAQPFVT
ncbi:isochorismatase family protein [Niveibacterium sp.]|uniref:isochorismatase family protein n=1 Tax=Niveibacterium sp. TaxID=2017444 RepID=UPI0035B11DCD